MDKPIQAAFDAILDLIQLVIVARGEQLTEEEHNKFMTVARNLIPALNEERRN